MYGVPVEGGKVGNIGKKLDFFDPKTSNVMNQIYYDTLPKEKIADKPKLISEADYERKFNPNYKKEKESVQHERIANTFFDAFQMPEEVKKQIEASDREKR